ncbi:MAG: lasso RiPP family leader peptide-containing protein [Anaerolineae bacterium]|nr:lasso RiPP family leader peptide-containing protein [Anaerolineae bacterium]MCA9887282.1 lasso RiPP family leader peptide-containing protein [Anaerolineae bacterium]MCA9894274.1 lasso RiPP family leader peptide-containing protein [Anaerolineae bacterium]
MSKKTYSTPTLSDHGKVATITKGNHGDHGMSGQPRPPRRN